MADSYDVAVVGAGPAGSAAALVAARAGLRVLLLERGPFPGAKNMYGGVIYGRILDTLVPDWWTEAPVQRWVTRRSTMVLTDTQALTVEFRGQDWDRPPYNGATAYRADFDSWLAGKATGAGATLACATTATQLIRDDSGQVRGVRTDRPGSDVEAKVVIACDGVNSFLAKEAGLYRDWSPAHFTVGVKEVLAVPREVLEERFNLTGDEGLDIEILGGTQGIPGGGFLYTNLDTIAVGAVLSVTGLRDSGKRPEDIIMGLKAHPAIAPLRDLAGDVRRPPAAHGAGRLTRTARPTPSARHRHPDRVRRGRYRRPPQHRRHRRATGTVRRQRGTRRFSRYRLRGPGRARAVPPRTRPLRVGDVPPDPSRQRPRR